MTTTPSRSRRGRQAGSARPPRRGDDDHADVLYGVPHVERAGGRSRLRFPCRPDRARAGPTCARTVPARWVCWSGWPSRSRGRGRDGDIEELDARGRRGWSRRAREGGAEAASVGGGLAAAGAGGDPRRGRLGDARQCARGDAEAAGGEAAKEKAGGLMPWHGRGGCPGRGLGGREEGLGRSWPAPVEGRATACGRVDADVGWDKRARAR